jgi:hypothetical protein
MRLGLNPTRVANVIGKEDLEELAKLVAEVDAGSAPKGEASDANRPDAAKQQGVELAPGAKSLADGRTIGEARADRAAAGGYDSLEADNLKRALRAFRKKLKSIRRDDESRLGGRYTSMGRKSKICAIQPPNEYPQAVWAKLVELKRLKKAGQGTFELPDQ